MTEFDTTEAVHHHIYKPLATKLKDGRIGYEYFLTSEPLYLFRCPCGDVERVSIREAVNKGWVDILELDES